jgi:iron complex outermembrane receptor protein
MYKSVIASFLVGILMPFVLIAQVDTVESNQVEVVGKKSNSNNYYTETQKIESIKTKDLDRTRGLSLGESLKQIPGVNSIQTGPSISKPMIHGLHSNRILILNNGVRQEGQQWGSEHAPEIDPFVATKLSVIKGAASIRYGSDAIGGVVLVEPKAIRTKPGVGGELNMVGMSNGQMGVGSGILEGAFGKKLSGLSWRTQGTYRRAGNFKTAQYFMENTGLQESNYSTALSYKKEHFGAELYYSQFNTTLGIFTGSASETLSDVMAAIARPKPITPSYFSYTIGRPYQTVKHDLFKANAYLKLSKLIRLDLVFARQQNVRSEYDYVPLSGRTTPELYLKIVTQTVDAIWQHKPIKNVTGSIGFNWITQGNVRQYQFLIPNFRNYGGGIFMIEKWIKNRFTLETGIRYDYRWLRVYTLDLNTAHVITPTYNWNNATGMVGCGYKFTERLSLMANIGNAWRAPTVNELFSNGVHQSAASYEIGNPNLVPEHAYNLNASINYTGNRFSADVGVYNNIINHYIYLKPDLQFIHTIRGAFPTFTYTQVNAVYRGLDLTLGYRFTKSLSLSSKSAFIFAYNNTIHNYLILAPANRFDNSLKYELGKLGKIRELYIAVTDLYVARQNRVPPNSDYSPPPPAYNLLGINIGFDIPAKKQSVSLNFAVNNALNVAYRDYLNRFRYFTNDLGRNFVIRLKIPFEILKKVNNSNTK